MTEPNDKQKEGARSLVHLWTANMFDSLRNGETMQLPPGAISTLTTRIACALSSRDTQIREVLEGLRNIPPVDPPCWCRVGFLPKEKHSPACLAARALWNRVNLTE